MTAVAEWSRLKTLVRHYRVVSSSPVTTEDPPCTGAAMQVKSIKTQIPYVVVCKFREQSAMCRLGMAI
ncbi:hypothetical protein TNCV_1362351 [Trichonephila clavipes]|nr:hypothetical protein TNCV_1362351 [Trichonephila clavipes]